MTVCEETRRRIRVSIWAYAYEFESVSLVSDHEFDYECLKINAFSPTSRPELDQWFAENFNPFTGMWIRNHPELHKIKKLYERHYKND